MLKGVRVNVGHAAALEVPIPVSRLREAVNDVSLTSLLRQAASPYTILGEARLPLELAQLLASDVFHGRGVERGNGDPVFIIPPFFGGNWSLGTLKDWLNKMGYNAHTDGTRLNTLHMDAMLRTQAAAIAEMHEAYGKKVIIVSHSIGGTLADILAKRYPQHVEHVFTAGSILNEPIKINPLILPGVVLAEAVNVLLYGPGLDWKDTGHVKELLRPSPVPLTSIHSKTDGVVHHETSIRPDADNREVKGTHLGLTHNRHVYEELAASLHEISRSRSRGPKRRQRIRDHAGRRRRASPRVQVHS